MGCFTEPLECRSAGLPGHAKAGGKLPSAEAEGTDQNSAVRGQSADALCLVSTFSAIKVIVQASDYVHPINCVISNRYNNYRKKMEADVLALSVPLP